MQYSWVTNTQLWLYATYIIRFQVYLRLVTLVFCYLNFIFYFNSRVNLLQIFLSHFLYSLITVHE